MESTAQCYRGFSPKPAPALKPHEGFVQSAPPAVAVVCLGDWASPMVLGSGHRGVPPPLYMAAQPTAEPMLLLSTANGCGVRTKTYRSEGRSQSPRNREPACMAAFPTCVLSLQQTQP